MISRAQMIDNLAVSLKQPIEHTIRIQPHIAEAILSTLRAIESAELPSEPDDIEVWRTFKRSGILKEQCSRVLDYADALRLAAESLALKLKDAEVQDEETRKLLSVERKRVNVLEDALRKVLDTREAEAKAGASYSIASDNFSEAAPECETYEHAMIAASQAETEAREALKGARV